MGTEASDPARVDATDSARVLREPEDSSRGRAAGGGGGGGFGCSTSSALGGPSVPEEPPPGAAAGIRAAVTALQACSSVQPALRAAW